MPKKSSKKGGNGLLPEDTNKTVFYPNLLLNPNISTQPNLDTSYKEIGIIHKSTSVAKNILMEYKSNLFNMVGKTPNSDNKFFSAPWDLCLNEIINDLKTYEELEPSKIFKIANLKFDFISIDNNSLTLNTYGTLLIKDKENS
jgi:hypothetical protein